jgi:hypothetical protein
MGAALFAQDTILDGLWFGPDANMQWTATDKIGSHSLFMPQGGAILPSMKLIARSVPKGSILFPETNAVQYTLPGWQVTNWERNGSQLLTWERLGSGPWDAFDLVVMVRPLAPPFAALPVTQEVPVPAALWLFGSGLLALFGWARRR